MIPYWRQISLVVVGNLIEEFNLVRLVEWCVASQAAIKCCLKIIWLLNASIVFDDLKGY